MDRKAPGEVSYISGDIIAEGQIKFFGQAANESMSDISSVSEFESELGYASCENDEESPESCDSDGGQQRVKPPRRKLQRKHRLDQLRKCEIYSNDSDTTVDERAVNARRLRRIAPKKEVLSPNARGVSVKSKSSNEFRRPRNGSKGSWTDSGVSMSKTDSQPSTLGESTKTRMIPQKLTQKNESRADVKVVSVTKELEESPVELLRGEIKRRSHSVSEFTRTCNNERNEKNGVVRKHSAQIDCKKNSDEGKGTSNRFDDTKGNENCGKVNRKPRYPEIIKLEDKEKSAKVKKVSSNKDKKTDWSSGREATVGNKKDNEDFRNLNEKETEIIRKLFENAKAAECKRKNSVQSHWSYSTSEGTPEESENARPRRSKLQRLKDMFLSKVQRSRNGGSSDSSPFKNDIKGMRQCTSPIYDNYFSDDASVQSKCVDHFCCCDFSDCGERGTDQLSHLGRVVKKRSILSRLFRNTSKSSENLTFDNGRAYRVRSQLETEIPIGRKRSGSTRSLPESLKYLWLKALSKSVENMGNQRLPNLLQPTDAFTAHPGFYVKRSRSSSSLNKCQFLSNLPNDISKSSDAISYYNQCIRSPPTPVRRSESLRSLNIGRHYDIATHVLQAKTEADDVADNNNLLYHPYFQGHTTRDDCNTNRSQIQDGSTCTCYANSPLPSPSSYYKGNPCIVGRDQSNWISNNRLSNEPMAVLSPRRKSSNSLACYCQENFFAANYFFAGDLCKQHEIAEKRIVPKKEVTEQVQSPRRKAKHEDCLIVAPLEVKVTKEKHAERVRLKTAKDFDTSV